ncbi:hypothetical protein, partial [Streptomyces guryensis]|uniref:hypothetical protein n=1 Tax=Streptomyces guryensis TaxID=2886947 RepID=UPI0027DFE334
SSWLNWAFTKESYAVARLLFRERYSPIEVRPGQTPAHSRPLVPYTMTRDTIQTMTTVRARWRSGSSCTTQADLDGLAETHVVGEQQVRPGRLQCPVQWLQLVCLGVRAATERGLVGVGVR